MGLRFDWPLRLRIAAAGHVPLFGAHLGCRPRRRLGRLRGNSRQRSSLYRRLWRVVA